MPTIQLSKKIKTHPTPSNQTALCLTKAVGDEILKGFSGGEMVKLLTYIPRKQEIQLDDDRFVDSGTILPNLAGPDIQKIYQGLDSTQQQKNCQLSDGTAFKVGDFWMYFFFFFDPGWNLLYFGRLEKFEGKKITVNKKHNIDKEFLKYHQYQYKKNN